MNRLLTIPISHYCERARWALDYGGVPYREERHLQILHRRPVRRAGGKRTVPVLAAPDRTLSDSADIVRYADEHAASGRRLYPDGGARRQEVEALERDHERAFGVETRRWAYYQLLPQSRLLLRYNGQGAPLWERAVLRAAFPAAKRLLVRYLKISDETAARAGGDILRTLDEVAARLEDGRPFLTGERFTAADLTFAALAAPVLLPEEHPVPHPPLAELHPSVRRQFEAFRAHPAGRFALELYRDHRRSPASPVTSASSTA